jgi:hypothetical protein
VTDSEYSYHNASVLLDEIEDTNPDGVIEADIRVEPFMGDQRWPVKCERCPHLFSDEGHFQVFTERVNKRTDTGEEMTLRDAAPGAMWNATWMTDFPDWCGPYGMALRTGAMIMPVNSPALTLSSASSSLPVDDAVFSLYISKPAA